MMQRKYNVGIIGCGRIAGVHLGNVLKHRRLNLKWILEEDEPRIKEVRAQFCLEDSIPFFPYSRREDLLSDQTLDAVLILSPTSTHVQYACDSLTHGKAVFCEKPISNSAEEIKRCYETAEKNGKPLLAGFVRRFDDAYCDVVSAATETSFGNIHYLHFTNRDSPKPSYEFLKKTDPAGCNIFSDMCVHDIDLLVWLTNCEKPESIYVSCHANEPVLRESGVADTLVAVVKYPTGVMATINASRDSPYGYDMRMEVFGSSGMATVKNPRRNSSAFDDKNGGRVTALSHSFPQRFEKAFAKELDHFVDCLDGTVSPRVKKEDGIRIAEIIEKGVLSFKKGQVVNF